VPTFKAAEIQRRLRRLAKQRVTSGLLSVKGAAALSSVGFEQVSEVTGAVAYVVNTAGFYTAGAKPLAAPGTDWMAWRPGAARSEPRTFTSSAASVAVGTPPTVVALKDGYRTAMSRLVAEARAVAADGVVGVRITRIRTHSGELPLWSFLAVGTAVRSIGRTRAGTPFTTDLSAAQTAAALRGGWVPVSYLACPVKAVRWVDADSRKQRRVSASNGEINAHTEAVNACRHQARTDFAKAARAVHADAAVMSAMTLSLGPSPGLAEVTVVITGTALARFVRGGTTSEPLTIMPLSRVTR
jgi:uncharacterized protein YbjQ (UPF0145 family)